MGESIRGCGSVRLGLDVWHCDPKALADIDAMEAKLRELIKKHGLGCRKVLRDQYDGPGAGFEIICTLEDSFVVIETWPQGNGSPVPYLKAVLDFCHFSGNHEATASEFADDLVAYVATKETTESRMLSDHGP